MSVLAHADGGFDPNNLGTSGWIAGAGYLRFQPVRWLYLACRGDYFWERAASNALGTAAPIAFPTSWVAEGTATVDVRPVDNVSFRVEYRHDHAASPLYYKDLVLFTPPVGFVPNARSQDTITVGATTWF
jgi:hypothetical protein